MYFFGHFGPVAFIARYLKLPILLAALFSLTPDLVDKSLALAGLSPSTRFIGHTIFFSILATVSTYLVSRSAPYAIATFIGAISHPLFDSVEPGAFIPWLYPFINYEWPPLLLRIWPTPLEIAFEIFGIGCVVYLWKSQRR